MKKPLHVLAVLCLIGAATAYFYHDIPAASNSNEGVKPAAGLKQIRSIGNNGGADPASSTALLEKRIQESNEKLREHAAKAYENSTPKTERLKLDAIMQFREPRCRELFRKWNLDDDTVDAALRIMEEREAELMTKRRAFIMKGISGASEFRTEQKIGQSLAEVQLSRLLGEERSDELRQLERLLDAEYLARARRNTSD